LTRSPRFVVVGAGMAGILSAVKLAEAGFDDVIV
jgi:glycine/D-amino acid oxidase-like deaminating enzyme